MIGRRSVVVTVMHSIPFFAPTTSEEMGPSDCVLGEYELVIFDGIVRQGRRIIPLEPSLDSISEDVDENGVIVLVVAMC